MKQKKCLTILLILGLMISISGCKATKEAIISDLVDLEQDHKAYTTGIPESQKRQIPRDFHLIVDKKFNDKFFSPWRLEKNRVSKQSLETTFSHFKNGKGYGENKQRIPQKRLEQIESNAQLQSYPNFIQHGITISNTNLRLLPTEKPYFTDAEKEGQGFPFDNLQNSAIAANTPILITHITKDGAWVLAETPFAHGWISIRDIAYAGPKFRKQFQSYPKYVAAIKEEVPIKTAQGNFLFNSNIGMILPRIKYNKYYYTVAVAQPSPKRFAYIKEALLPRTAGQTKPMALTIDNVAKISNELLDLPYGWGGMYHNRDCSAMLKDLFTPFGIWLPRNSRAQAHKGGIYIDMKSLTEKQKEEMLIANGIPYLTLVWMPGHIMLYIGEKDGEALVFHNIWGLRTTDALGRKVIGKSVITTLEPGKSLPNREPGKTLLKRVEGMTLLVPRYQA